MSYFLENEEVVKEQETLQDEAGMQQENEQDGIASIEPLLDNRIVRAIREMGFEKLSPIQEQAIPYLLQGEDIIGQAQTGTGKTAAFGIPAIQHINPDVKKLQTIILCPTRELAIQAAEELRKIAKYMHGIKVLPVYGGQDISRQIAGLRGVQIIVGTPGRVMDHMRRRTIKLDLVNMVVLDEADEMLNMGFREDMELILGQIPGEHQTALFSATMPKPILEITDRFQNDAKLVKVAAQELTIPLVSQKFYRVKNQDKDAACVRLLEYYQPKLTLIFCNTKKKVDELYATLGRRRGASPFGSCPVNLTASFVQLCLAQSCGKCVPCREGTKQMLALLDDITKGNADENTLALLEETAKAVQMGSLCGLGKTAPNPILSTLRHFRDEYETHVKNKRCPAGQCKALAVPEILADKCRGCTVCAKKCPVGAISGALKQPHKIDVDKCIRCGACKTACKFGAVTGL